MKILGISGSPNKNGNNKRAIDKCLSIAEEKGFETEQINLANKDIKSCTDCGLCKKKLDCSIDDDMDKVRKKLKGADGIIISSPVYFGSVSSQIKKLFDRTLPLRRNGFLLKNKVGFGIAIGGSRNGGQEFTIQAIQNWMHIHGMIVVGDNSHFGGILEKEIEKDKTGLKTIQESTEKLCKTLNALK